MQGYNSALLLLVPTTKSTLFAVIKDEWDKRRALVHVECIVRMDSDMEKGTSQAKEMSNSEACRLSHYRVMRV